VRASNSHAHALGHKDLRPAHARAVSPCDPGHVRDCYWLAPSTHRTRWHAVAM